MANRLLASSLKLAGMLALTAFLTSAHAQSVTQWDESINGDLSGNQAAPNNLTLVLGTNAIIGNLRNTSTLDNQDWIMLAVPGGLQLSAVVLKAYSSTDQQGFTEFRPERISSAAQSALLPISGTRTSVAERRMAPLPDEPCRSGYPADHG